MTTTSANENFQRALAQALSLPEDERRELYETLGESLYVENDTSDEVLEKIKERIARIDRGEAKLYTGEELRAEMERRRQERRK